VADFDGNGYSDFAVFRPSTCGWYFMDPDTQASAGLAFGTVGDIPVPADYDGDGRADVAVYRPETGYWYRLNSSDGSFTYRQFGEDGDTPSPASIQPR
jgi:hypothetical protein